MPVCLDPIDLSLIAGLVPAFKSSGLAELFQPHRSARDRQALDTVRPVVCDLKPERPRLSPSASGQAGCLPGPPSSLNR